MSHFISDNSRWFEPARRAQTDRLKAIIDNACIVLHAQDRAGGGQRNKWEQRRIYLKVEAIISDILHALCSGVDALRVHRDPNHYKSDNPYLHKPVEAKTFIEVLNSMATAHIVEIAPGQNGKGVSRIRPGRWLIDMLAKEHWSLEDTCTDQSGVRTIILKDSRGGLVHYPIDAIVGAMQERMKGINQWIATFDIGLFFDGHDLPASPCDSQERHLYRVFNQGRFDRGGRLYGGFWIGMPKEDRWRIGIDGKELVQLDFNAMFVRLLYARAGAVLPQGDPYIWPEAEQLGLSRSTIKRLLNARLFDEKPRRRYPKLDPGDPPDLFPDRKKVPIRSALGCIERRHAAINHLLGTGIGHELFFDESEIILDVLERCRGENVPVLPIHDALLVPKEHFRVAGDHMAAAFKNRTRALGQEAEARIVATLLFSTEELSALKRLESTLVLLGDSLGRSDIGMFGPDRVWKWVRDGEWSNEGKTKPVLSGGRPLPPSDKRVFPKGERLNLLNRLCDLCEAKRGTFLTERAEGTTFIASTNIAHFLIAAMEFDAVIVARAKRFQRSRDERRKRDDAPSERGFLTTKDVIRRFVWSLTLDRVRAIGSELDELDRRASLMRQVVPGILWGTQRIGMQ